MKQLIIVFLCIPLLFILISILLADKFEWWMIGASAFFLLFILITLDCYQGIKRQLFWRGVLLLIAGLGFVVWASSIFIVGQYHQVTGSSRWARQGALIFNSISEHFGITGVVIAMLAASIFCIYYSYKLFKKRLDYK